MLEYVPIKEETGRPVGRLVREGETVLLTASVEAKWTLWTEQGKRPILPNEKGKAKTFYAVTGSVGNVVRYWGRSIHCPYRKSELFASPKETEKHGVNSVQAKEKRKEPNEANKTVTLSGNVSDCPDPEPPEAKPCPTASERAEQQPLSNLARESDSEAADSGANLVQAEREQTIGETARQAASFARLQAVAHACFDRWERQVLPDLSESDYGVNLVQEETPSPRFVPKRSAAPSETARNWSREIECFLRRPPSEPTVDLFPKIFPNAVWHPVIEQGKLLRYEASWRYRNRQVRLLAVPGNESNRPGNGFCRYLKSGAVGYWIAVQEP